MEIDSDSCFYFCSHFHRVFKSKVNIKGVPILRRSNKVIGHCSHCQDKIFKKLIEENHILSDTYFFESRKLLIQYFPIGKEKHKVET